MKALWSMNWNTSIRPNKQRKFRFNAPLHVKQKFLHTLLSKDLRKKYGSRSVLLRKGDTVTVLRGQYKKKKGKVSRTSIQKGRVFIEGIENLKKDGNKTLVAFQPSNLMITDLELSDKRRKKKLDRKTGEEVKKK